MVAQDGEHEIVVDKSRFICHVKRVYNDQDAMEFIKEIKKIHWNATHNCSAYQVGDFNEIQKPMMTVSQVEQPVSRCLKY